MAVWTILLLAGSARAQENPHAFHRDLDGRQWVVVSDPNGAFSLRRFDSGGALIGEVSFSSVSAHSDFQITSDPGGDAWVSGATSTGGPAGFGVWRVSADGRTMISSSTVYGAFDIYPSGIAVDASSRVWVTGPEQTSADATFRFALWRFEEDGALSSGFPVYQQRAGGVLDGGLSIAIDADGDVWSAGVSSNPAAAAYDLALWRFDSSGGLRPGFPVYRGSAYASIDGSDAGIVMAAGEKVWVAASQVFPGCAQRQAALFRFDRNGTVELQRFWHNAAEDESTGINIALASDGGPWVLGRSSDTTAVWSYDRFGALDAGYPRTDGGLNSTGIALDAGGVPWVVYGSTPGAFIGAQAVAGASGPPSCAQLTEGTIAGSVSVAGGTPAGSSVTVIVSSTGFNEPLTTEIIVSTGGASVPFSVAVMTPGDYQIGAFLGDDPELIDLSTPIGFYRDFTPISLASGGSASGVDFTIALDTAAPVVAVAFPVAGSTIAALPVIEGTAADANGVGDLELAVLDVDADLWYDPNVPGWSASAVPLYRSVNAQFSGPPYAVDWTVAISSVDNGSFGRLDERLVQGHRYRVLALGGDFVGNPSEPAETSFTWDGPTGDVGPPAPSGLNGQALGTSSIAWSWNASQGATAYFLASSSYTAPFASVTTTSYISEALLPAETLMVCVAGVNLLTVGDYSCSTAETDPAVPGAVVAAEVWGTSIAWSWTSGGNSGNARYELTLSTDGFAAHVSTPVPVGSFFGGTSYTAEGLTPDTVYAARVRAYNLAQKLSEFSESGSTRTAVLAPETPYNLTGLLDRGEAAVFLSWSTSGVVSASSYRVYRSTEFASLSLLASTTETSYTDFPAGSAFYFYSVSAVGELGGESPPTVQTAVRFDVTPPLAAFVQPEDGATLSRPYTIIAEASDDFTSATVRFEVDGVARATTTVSHQFLWDIRAETDGPHTLGAVATDDDGNQTSISRSVIVAYSTPAAPTIIVPSDDYSTLATTFTVQGYAPLLTSVRVLADAVVIGTAVPDGLGQWGLSEAPFPGRGDFLLTAVAFEDRGESFATAPLRVASFAEPPTEPGALAALVDREAGTLALSWAASTGTTLATSYRVERATAAEGEYALRASTPTTSYTDEPSLSGAYVYRVRAHHGSGLFSAFVSASALFDATPPAAITDLRVDAYRSELGEIDLAWTAAVDDVSGVTEYKLYTSTYAGFEGAAPQTIGAASTSFTVSVASTALTFFALSSVDGAGNESALSNTAVFDLIAPVITAIDLAPGEVLSRPRFVTVAASDGGSTPRVIFSVDGVSLSTATAPPYSFFLNASAFADGSHTLGVRAVDGSGNAVETSRAFIVNYFPPPVPTIILPVQNTQTASSVLAVTGTAEPGITVEIFINGVLAGSVAADSFGQFYADGIFLPAEGAVSVTAAAKDLRGSSPQTAAVNVILDFGPPGIPQFPTAQSMSAGRVRLTWLPPSGEVPTIYRVYRSMDEFELVQGSTANPSLLVGSVAALEHVDHTPGDGLYFYAVSAVDAASNEGLLSEVAPAVADGVAPTASVLLTQSVPPLAPGQHPVELTLSEALATPPILTFTPQGRTPAVVGLSGVTTTLWRGTVTVNASINSDLATFAFQGSDFLGNVGTTIVDGGTVTLNTRGPVGSVSVSSALASVGTQAFTLTLNKPAVTTPTLSVTPFGQTAIPVVLAGSDLLWTGALTIDTATGDGPAYIGFSAIDSVGNVGTSLSGGATSFVIDTTPPAAPQNLSAAARPGGTVDLLWSAPSDGTPALYYVFRDGVRLASPVAPIAGGGGSFTDAPSEGAHDYAVTAVDAAGNEGPASNTVNSSADQTPPAPPFDLAASARAVEGIEGLDLTWTPGAGEASASFRLHHSTTPIVGLTGVPFMVSTAPAVFFVPGEDAHYYFAVTALDLAGNISDSSNVIDLLFLNAAPRIVITGVQHGAYYNHNVNPAFDAVDLNLDAGSVQATLDGSPFASGATVTAEGSHTLVVNASDLGAHASSATVVFTIDKAAPQIALSGVAQGALLHSTASITIIVTDLSPVTTAHVLTNNTISAAYASGDIIDDDGSYVLIASATDRAGNTTTRSLSFSMDTAPRLPLNLAARLEDGVGADLSWASPAADVLAYRVYKNGVRVSASLHASKTFRDTSYASDALHVYEVTAVDQLGQEGPRAKVTIPPVGLSLAGYGLVIGGQQALTRGFSDTLRLGLANRDGQTRLIGPAALELSAGGQVYATAQAGAVSVGAGASGESSGVVAVSPALAASALLKASVQLPSEEGTSALLVKTFTLAVREPASPVVEVFTGALIRGALTQVRVKLNNRGSAPYEVKTAVVEGFTPAAANEVSASLKTLEGTILSQAALVQTAGTGITARVEGGNLTYFATVEPGASFLFSPVEVEVPENAGASLKVEGRVKTFTGTQNQAAVEAPAYTATVAPGQPVYDQGVQVILAGQARDQAQALLGGATVQVRITSKGYTRTLTTVTAPSGSYSVVFNPLPNEAGVYNLSASGPEAISNAVQSSFTIVGFGFSPTALTARLNQNSSLALNVNLTNTGESPVTGLTLQLEGVPAGVNLVLGGAPSTLLAGVQGALNLRVEASPAAAIGQSVPVLVAVDSNGFERRLPITVNVLGSQPIPRVSPQAFEVGMLAGEVRRQVILLENIGFSAWENVTLSVPTLPWVKITGTGQIGNIPAGGNASFGISFEPPAVLPTGQFVQNPLIEVLSSNNQTIPVNVGITVTSSKQGNLAFTVINADRPKDALGNGVPVPGADVTLTNLEIAGLTFSGKADSNGIASFTGIPSGSYNWRAQATNFGPSSGVESVESGLTKAVNALLFTSMVTYEWGVTESTIKDTYDLTLDVTFKTDVLAPALVVEPKVISIPMVGGQTALAQYTITNKGLVSAFNVDPRASLNDDAVILEIPFTTIPELKPGQSVVVPVKVTLVHASCHITRITHTAGYKCAYGSEAPCVVEAVIFLLGQLNECAQGTVSGYSAQMISNITGTPAPKPCTCDTSISDGNSSTVDYLSAGGRKSYSVKVTQSPTNCPCKLTCDVGTAWATTGDLEFEGGNTGCNVTVTSPGGAGGVLSVEKGGLEACKGDTRTIANCQPVTTLTLAPPSVTKTVVGGSPITLTATVGPDPRCSIEWKLTGPAGVGSLSHSGNTATFTPGASGGTAQITVKDAASGLTDSQNIDVVKATFTDPYPASWGGADGGSGHYCVTTTPPDHEGFINFSINKAGTTVAYRTTSPHCSTGKELYVESSDAAPCEADGRISATFAPTGDSLGIIPITIMRPNKPTVAAPLPVEQRCRYPGLYSEWAVTFGSLDGDGSPAKFDGRPIIEDIYAPLASDGCGIGAPTPIDSPVLIGPPAYPSNSIIDINSIYGAYLPSSDKFPCSTVWKQSWRIGNCSSTPEVDIKWEFDSSGALKIIRQDQNHQLSSCPATQ